MVFDELQQTNKHTTVHNFTQNDGNMDVQFTNNVVCCLKNKFKLKQDIENIKSVNY